MFPDCELLMVLDVGIYISDLIQWKIPDDFMVMIFGKPVPSHTIKASETVDNVLEIDVEKAWKEPNQQPQWNNEVLVQVFIGP